VGFNGYLGILKNCCYRAVPKTGENKNRLKTIVGLSLGLIFLSSFSFTQIASAGFNFDGVPNVNPPSVLASKNMSSKSIMFS